MPKTPVFISFSGDRARTVATALSTWLRRVVQQSQPWCSPELGAGKRWSSEIAARLATSKVGIVVVTRESHEAPWLNFEAGALSNLPGDVRVITYFVGLDPTDVEPGPLTQFQWKLADREGTLDVVRAVNSTLDDPSEAADVDDVFGRLWEELEKTIAEAVKMPGKQKVVARPVDEMMHEALGILRDLQRRPAPGGTTPPEVAALRILTIDPDFMGDRELLDAHTAITKLNPRTSNPQTEQMLDRRLSDLMSEIEFRVGRVDPATIARK